MKTEPVFADRRTTETMKVVGEKVQFLLDHSQTGSYEVYLHDGPEGCGPPHHAHPWDEAFYVLAGQVRFEAGGVTKILGAGELVHIPGGTPHQFRYLTPVQILSISMTDGAKKLFGRLTNIIPDKFDKLSDDKLAELRGAITAGVVTQKE